MRYREVSWATTFKLQARRLTFRCFLLFLILALLGCDPEGDINNLEPLSVPSLNAQQQIAQNLLEQYSIAIRNENIDRLQRLFETNTNTSLPQLFTDSLLPSEISPSLQSFQEQMSEAFFTQTLVDHELINADIQLAGVSPTIAFLEAITVLEADLEDSDFTWVQRTRLWQTTLDLTLVTDNGEFTFVISEVVREGPLVQVTTPGKVLVQAPARIRVTPMSWSLRDVGISLPEEPSLTLSLTFSDGAFHGLFKWPHPTVPETPSLQIRLLLESGSNIVFHHPYKLRQPGQSVVHRLAQPNRDQNGFLAVDAAPDGSAVWFGGPATQETPTFLDLVGIYRLPQKDSWNCKITEGVQVTENI